MAEEIKSEATEAPQPAPQAKKSASKKPEMKKTAEAGNAAREQAPAVKKKPAAKQKAAKSAGADKSDALDAALEAAAAAAQVAVIEAPSEAQPAAEAAQPAKPEGASAKAISKKTLGIVAAAAVVVVAAFAASRAQQPLQQAMNELVITAEAVGSGNAVLLSEEVAAESLSLVRTQLLSTSTVYAQETAALEEAAKAEAQAAAAAAAAAATPVTATAATPAAASNYAGASTAPNGNFQSKPYENFKSRIGNIHNSQSINSDVQGWIYVPGTNIDYPILRDPNSDLSYYLHRNIYKNHDNNGVIWTGPGTRFASSAGGLNHFTTIYGHNWKNCYAPIRVRGGGDIMFEQLAGYHYLSTAQSYPYFYFSTEGQDYTVAIFACFYCRPSNFYYWSSTGSMSVVDEARSRSLHNFDVDVDSSDKIITLSTCTRMYGYGADQKFVVMGRVLRDGETPDNVSVSANGGHWNP